VEAEVETAKIGFTEELLALMEQKNVSRVQLASLLGVKPSRITALLRGSNNFTLETMVRICRALGAKYEHRIQPQHASDPVRKEHPEGAHQDSLGCVVKRIGSY
jgi:plasmid maintenance system antidote protein VapI